MYIFYLVKMKFKPYTGNTWSDLELLGLVEDEDSQVYLEKLKKHLGLHPFHLTNLNAALNEILSSNLYSYDDELKGFLLAYKYPKLLTPLGEIFYDTCFIHIDIEAEFYVFRPKVGCILKGIVNKKGLDHIGVLVHKAFNVSIPKPDDEENWVGNDLEIGQEVKFRITLLDAHSKLPFIRGTLNADEYLQGCKLMLKTINNKKCTHNIDKSPSKGILQTKVKNAKEHIFFNTESEDSSDEALSQKSNKVQEKKWSKKIKREVSVIQSENEKKEIDKMSSEKNLEHRKCKQKLKKVETSDEQWPYNTNLKNEIIDHTQSKKSRDEKIKIQQESNSQYSNSSVHDDQDNFKSRKLSSEIAKTSFALASEDDIDKTNLEYYATSSSIEDDIGRSPVDSKCKLKRCLSKGQHLYGNNVSIVSSNNDCVVLKNSNLSKKQKINVACVKHEEMPVDDRLDKLDNTITEDIKCELQKTSKMKRKKHKSFENQEDRLVQKRSSKKQDNKSNQPNSELFSDIKIKKEGALNDFESTLGVSTEVSNIAESSHKQTHLHAFDNYIRKEDEINTSVKKRKRSSKMSNQDANIIEEGNMFDNFPIKVENLNDVSNDGITKDMYSIDNTESDLVQKASFSRANNNIIDDEMDIKSDMKILKKIKTEKLTTDDSESCGQDNRLHVDSKN